MPNLMTVDELSQYLRVTKRTIYRLLKKGDLPAVKVGHKWRFNKNAIDQWLHSPTENHELRLLVIDDDPIISALFDQTLKSHGHKLAIAESAVRGLEYVERLSFDRIFLDLQMPNMNGAELFRLIRQIDQHVPVTIITGYPDSDLMDKALAYGSFSVMKKPFGQREIAAAIGQPYNINERAASGVYA